MNKSQKLFESIGRLDDRDLAAALDYKAESPAKPRARFSVIMAAAVVAVGLMLMAFSYGDEILNAIFKRQTELVDDKAAIINESVTVGEVTMTVDKVVVERESDLNFDGQCYVTFRMDGGVFENGIAYSRVVIQKLADGQWQTDEVLENVTMFEKEEWDYSDFDPNSNEITQIYTLFGPYTDYRITFYDLSDRDGKTVYAKEISVDFTVKCNKVTPTTMLDLYTPDPAIEFELDGYRFQIHEIRMTPESFQIDVKNMDNDVIEASGRKFYAGNLLCDSWKSKEAADALIAEREYSAIHEDAWSVDGSEDIKAEHDRLVAKLKEYPIMEQGLDDEIHKYGYEIRVELSPKCGAKIRTDRQSHCLPNVAYKNGFDDPVFVNSAVQAFGFTSPIYIEDIVRVYAVKRSDPSVEVNIWVPAEDESLESYLN